jgi:hypothetical protein
MEMTTAVRLFRSPGAGFPVLSVVDLSEFGNYSSKMMASFAATYSYIDSFTTIPSCFTNHFRLTVDIVDS